MKEERIITRMYPGGEHISRLGIKISPCPCSCHISEGDLCEPPFCCERHWKFINRSEDKNELEIF